MFKLNPIEVRWDIEQRTQEWYDEKQGKMSASGVKDLVGTPAARKKYIEKIAFGGLMKSPMAEAANYSAGASARRGTDLEDAATGAINQHLNREAVPCGFIRVSEHFGISPDYITESLTFAVEIKCLEVAKMAESVYMVGTTPLLSVIKEHRAQVVAYFLIPTIETVFFALFMPFNEMANDEDYLKMVRIDRNDVLDEIAAMEHQIGQAELEINSLRKMKI